MSNADKLKNLSNADKLKNLSNADKLKIMSSAFVPSKSYMSPIIVRHLKYDWLEQYPWLCYSSIGDGAYYLYCVFVANKSSRDVQSVHIPYYNWPDAQGCVKRYTKTNGIHRKSMENYECFLK